MPEQTTWPSLNVTPLHCMDAAGERCLYCGKTAARIKDVDNEGCNGSAELRAAAELLAKEVPTLERLEVLRRLGHALI